MAVASDLRILFVEDQPDDIELARRQLAREGLQFEWRAVGSEDDLRRGLEQFHPHVVLCDYSIPGFSGRDALRIVKEVSPLTPFIFLSGTIGEETAVDCLREGATDYVLKGNPRRLGVAVRRALDDVEERHRYEERIRHLANFDALTGLPNRVLIGDRTAQALIHAERTQGQVALMILNIDGFRLVNDGIGHAAGDAMLKEIAQRLERCVRTGDTVARTGGDEFTALLADLRAEDVHVFVTRVLEAVKEPLAIDGQSLCMTASAGVALYPNDGRDSETLVRAATTAMHRAKAQERGAFLFSSPQAMREALERITMETGITQAQQRHELRLAFQVQHDLETGRACGVEALMRWNDGERAVPPGVFIRIAEEIGAIRTMGQWALREACLLARPWILAADPPIVLGVNVSPLQLQEAGFVEMVGKTLAETQFPAGALELEITESALMGVAKDALDVITGLKRLGVRVAIDDFGTGFSSLSYLSRLAIDRLKIDASFVRRMVNDWRDAAIARSIVSLGHGLGLRVIAEGVETREQLIMLRRMGCDEVQGYLHAPPLAPEEVPALLKRSFGMV